MSPSGQLEEEIFLSTLMDKMQIDMDLRGLSPHTKAAYLLHVKHFAEYFGKPLEELGESNVRVFMHHVIVERKLSSSYAVVCYSALKFLFETTRGRRWNKKVVPRIKRENKLPNILTKEEIILLFNATNNLKHRAVLMTAYSAGLRVSELANLKITDIDSENMQLFIRQGKGKNDRYAILSEANLVILREYYKQYRPKVWLFPGQYPTKPITPTALRLIFTDAKQKVGIKKKVSIHSLRHSFATHLLEDNVHICHIQKLLGHKSLGATSVYLHITRLSLLNIKSPIDTMVGLDNG